jgi:hypothetical protein
MTPSAHTMLWLAQRLREAAHYCTELSELEKHCESVAADLEALAAAQPVPADAAREDEPDAHPRPNCGPEES